MTEEHPTDEDFRKLVEIVADVYRVLPREICSKKREHMFTQPRHIVAAIWSEGHSLEDTARRLYYGSSATVLEARARWRRLHAGEGIIKARVDEVTRRVVREIPWVMGIYDEEPEPAEA